MAQSELIDAHGLQYARSEDFCRIFHDDLPQLYRLAYLLTASQEAAELCFLAALDDTMSGNLVFRNWARTWSRRAVVKNAIRAIAPAPNQTSSRLKPATLLQDRTSINALATLVPFERFVFILTVLEKYPDRECATLLNCRVHDVVQARTRVLRQFAAYGPASEAQFSRRAELAIAANASEV